jgi:hypothetical protein
MGNDQPKKNTFYDDRGTRDDLDRRFGPIVGNSE